MSAASRARRASASEGPGHEQESTPPRRALKRNSSDVLPDKVERARRKLPNGLSFVEGPAMYNKTTAVVPAAGHEGAQPEPPSPKRAAAKRKPDKSKEEAKFVEMFADCAQDYFSSNGCGPLHQRALATVLERSSESSQLQSKLREPISERFDAWLVLMQAGFSVLLEGIGSKREVLLNFQRDKLLYEGKDVEWISGFSSRRAIVDFFRTLLEKEKVEALRGRGAVEGMVAALAAARVAAAGKAKPLYMVVHGLEAMASTHQAALAMLAAAPGVHLIASIDNMWAPLAWDSRTLRNFNFARESAHTFQGYETEADIRYPGGLPTWTGLGKDQAHAPEKSLALVLRSLTNIHRELVFALAKAQSQSAGYARGVPFSALLQIAERGMIATSTTKLRHLLNELKDHEVVTLRSMPDGAQLYQLKFDTKTLGQLARSRIPTDASTTGDQVDDVDDEDDDDEDD